MLEWGLIKKRGTYELLQCVCSIYCIFLCKNIWGATSSTFEEASRLNRIYICHYYSIVEDLAITFTCTEMRLILYSPLRLIFKYNIASSNSTNRIIKRCVYWRRVDVTSPNMFEIVRKLVKNGSLYKRFCIS